MAAFSLVSDRSLLRRSSAAVILALRFSSISCNFCAFFSASSLACKVAHFVLATQVACVACVQARTLFTQGALACLSESNRDSNHTYLGNLGGGLVLGFLDESGLALLC